MSSERTTSGYDDWKTRSPADDEFDDDELEDAEFRFDEWMDRKFDEWRDGKQ